MQPNLAALIEAELSKRWREPRCPALKARYEAWREVEQREDTRLTARMAGILYVLFSFTDLVLIADVSFYSILCRLVIGTAFVIGVDHQVRRGVRLSIIDVQCAVVVLCAYAAWLTISSQSANPLNVSHYLTYGAIFMMVQNIFFNLRFTVALTSSTLITVSFVVSLLTLFSVTKEYAVAIGTLYFSTYLLTLIVNWKLNEERYRVFLNSAQAEIRHKEATEHSAALLRLSTTDALTGLSNRRAIDDELRALWDDWQSEGKSFAVVLIDVDYFKRFNDHYGHQEGDRCLIAIAQAMEAATVGKACTLGRFGGEEFILLFRTPTKERIATIMEEIRSAVEALRIAHEQRPDYTYVVTVSVGGAFSQDVSGSKVERLVTDADHALYAAKKGNRNCARLFDANDPQRLDMEESIADLLRTAIAQDRLAMVYQPIREAESGRIAAAEALMRLTTSTGRTVSPAVFIPIAERTGAIVDLGAWAIRTVFTDMLSDDTVPLVSVNVSAVQLKAPGFSLTVAAMLGEFRLDPGRLALEITESLQIESQPEIVRTIGELRRLGVRIWLDDFGTGFAGLSCIREIEFDTVKIDRSFLHASQTARGAEMFRNIVGLVKSAGCVTVVEGVQTAEQQALSIEQGVGLLQGYHLGRPMPAAELRQQIQQSGKAQAQEIAA